MDAIDYTPEVKVRLLEDPYVELDAEHDAIVELLRRQVPVAKLNHAMRFRTCRRRIDDRQRLSRKFGAVCDPATLQDAVPSQNNDPMDIAIRAEEAQRLDQFIAELPDMQREVIELRVTGMKNRSIARALGITEQTVARRQKVATAALSRRLLPASQWMQP